MQKWLHYFASDTVGELALSSAIDRIPFKFLSFPFSAPKLANPGSSSGVVLIFLLLERMRSDSFMRSRTYQSTATSPEPSLTFASDKEISLFHDYVLSLNHRKVGEGPRPPGPDFIERGSRRSSDALADFMKLKYPGTGTPL